MAAKLSNDNPFVVVILGCTGTGKSKLAIEIAQEINGEIISADSMQVYKGLDIITNKVTEEEQAMVPHHMINIVEANEKFSVVEFQAMALAVVCDIMERQKVPIIVGGTNYYIEALLRENLIETKQTDNEPEKDTTVVEHDISEHVYSEHANAKHEHSRHEHPKKEQSQHTNEEHDFNKHEPMQHENHPFPNHENPLKCLKNENSQNLNTRIVSMYDRLVEVDPTMALKLHPNDTRKITRSLQVYEHTGKTHSELIAKQQSQEGASNYGGPMRFKNVCVLWLQCELTTLDKRLDARVDKMLEQGLMEELLEFHKFCTSSMFDPNTTDGIFQSIGFKEFHKLFNTDNHAVEENTEVFTSCVDSMKSATRRYARKQIKWVTNRFLGRPSTCAPDVYGVDATDIKEWGNKVLGVSLSIVKALMAGEEVQGDSLMERIDSYATSKHSRYICEICNDRTIIGDKCWNMHLKSRSHRHYRKKRKQNET